jgi:glycosyltransferase involved in cell wall biosynthesis
MTDSAGSTARLPSVDPSTSRPFWSVIIPVHNRTLFLPECLGCVLDQAPAPDAMEIFVADDASPTDLGPLIQQHGRGRVRYLRTGRQRGLYGNLNDAMSHTTGRWIHVLHDDDLVLPGFYETLRRALERQPAPIAMACTHYTNWKDQDGATWSPAPFRAGPGLLEGWIEQLVMGNPLNVPAVVYRRTVFEQRGVFREDLPFAADWEMYLRAAAAFGWWYQPENLARFRMHRGNQTWLLNALGRTATDIRRTLEVAEEYLPAEVKQRFLPQARQLHGRNFLAQAAEVLNRGNTPLGLTLLRECLLLGGDAIASDAFFQQLARPEAAPLRAELIAAWKRSPTTA